MSERILYLPDSTKSFVPRTGASDIGLGAVLMQEHIQKLFPVSYASRKLSLRERRYSTIERECLAIVWLIGRFRTYLYSREFLLETDHQPLIYLNGAKFWKTVSCDGWFVYRVILCGSNLWRVRRTLVQITWAESTRVMVNLVWTLTLCYFGTFENLWNGVIYTVDSSRMGSRVTNSFMFTS